jgi:hypothetical protein
MDKHPVLKELFSKTHFSTAGKRYTVIFRYVMKEIKIFPVTEEKEVRAQFVKKIILFGLVFHHLSNKSFTCEM